MNNKSIASASTQLDKSTSSQPSSRLTDDYSDASDSTMRMSQMGENFMNSSKFSEEDKQSIIKYIDELKYAEKRDNALVELSRQREHFSELAPFIWHSVGTIAALLQEIVAVYPQLSPPNLDTKTSNKACNVLALLQCVASHKETRQLFLKAHIPLFLYPFLNTVSKGRPFEYLRLTSLGVIGALVKMDDSEVISFLLQTEIIPLCLRIMERGTELSQTVATFIIQKILLDEQGLNYLCQTAERFFAVSTVLNNMVISQQEKASSRLLKHIIRCYNRLAENHRARLALKENVPLILKESKLLESLDDSSKRCLKSLNDQIFNQAIQPMDNELSLTQQQQQQLQAKSQQEGYQQFGFMRQKTPVNEMNPMVSQSPMMHNSQMYGFSNPMTPQHFAQAAQNPMINRPSSTVNEMSHLQNQNMAAAAFNRMTIASPPPMGNFTQMNQAMSAQNMYYQQPQAMGQQTQAQSHLYMPQPHHQMNMKGAPAQSQAFIPQIQSPHQNFMMSPANIQYQFQQYYNQQYDQSSHQMYGGGQAGYQGTN